MSAWSCGHSHGYSRAEASTGEGDDLPLSIVVRDASVRNAE